MDRMDKKSISDAINLMSDKLGYTLGSALSYNSFDSLMSPKYPIAFIGLNPGGKDYVKPTIESENGKCDYYYENWTVKGEGKKTPPDEKDLAPLQQQIIKLYKRLADILCCDYKYLMDNSIMANLVPFRSPNWNSLSNKNESLTFSRELWSSIIASSKVSLVICMSSISFFQIGEILNGKGYNCLDTESETKRIGWGSVTYQIKKYMKNDSEILVIRLPHLSRYKIFNSEKCSLVIEYIFMKIKINLGF